MLYYTCIYVSCIHNFFIIHSLSPVYTDILYCHTPCKWYVINICICLYYTSIGLLIALISISTHTGFIKHALYPVSNINVFLYSNVVNI